MAVGHELPTLAFATRHAFEAWLEEHHAHHPGLWLQIARKGSGLPSVTYAEAVEVALCYGWIDGQKGRSTDPHHWLQRFGPRRPRSRWSQVNSEKAMTLIEAGAMRPAGLAEVERAQADGRWDAAYAPSSRATVPEDLERALDADDRARAFFATLDATNRYAILHRIEEAKRPDTRARRIAKFVTMLAAEEKLYP
jgi:uncharacterized protein YdeI (YjbR/CyaY-like superfamily)